MIDLENPNIIAISNLVDNKVSDFETDSRPKIPGSDPNTAIYETKMINLEFVSNSLLVQFDGHREAEGDIRVFYKLIRGDGDDDHSTYIPFNTNGLPDKVVNPNKGRDAFSEYKFTAENTAQFKSFMIKVVMTSTNQAKPPSSKNQSEFDKFIKLSEKKYAEKKKFDNMRSDLDSLKQDMDEIKTLLRNIMDK